MGHSTDIELFRKRMATGWKAIGPANVPLLYDNGKAGVSAPSTFVHFSVRPSSEVQTNLGNGRVRSKCEGRVWLKVAVPVGTPDGEAWALADRVGSIFNRWRTPDGNLHCGEVESRILPDDKYFIIILNVLYWSSRTV